MFYKLKKIWKLVLNDFLSSTAIQAFDIYTVWYIAHTTQNQHLIALFGSLGILNIIISPVGGILADNYPRNQIIKRVSYLRSLLFIGLFIIVFLVHQIELSVLIVSGVLSILSAFYTPACETLVPDVSNGEQELFKNNTYVNLASQLSSIAGAGVGSVLIMSCIPSTAYFSITVLLILSSLFVIKFLDKTNSNNTSRIVFHQVFNKDSYHQTLQNWMTILKMPFIKVIFPYACFVNLGFWMTYYLMPVYLNHVFKRFTFAYPLQELTIAISALICGTILSRFSDFFIKRAKFYVLFLIAQSSGIVLMPILFSLFQSEIIKLFILILVWSVYGVFNFLTGLIFVTKVQQLINSDTLGTTFGIIYSVFGALDPISAGLSGLIKHVNSISLLAVASVMLIVSFVMLFDKRVNNALGIQTNAN